MRYTVDDLHVLEAATELVDRWYNLTEAQHIEIAEELAENDESRTKEVLARRCMLAINTLREVLEVR